MSKRLFAKQFTMSHSDLIYKKRNLNLIYNIDTPKMPKPKTYESLLSQKKLYPNQIVTKNFCAYAPMNIREGGLTSYKYNENEKTTCSTNAYESSSSSTSRKLYPYGNFYCNYYY